MSSSRQWAAEQEEREANVANTTNSNPLLRSMNDLANEIENYIDDKPTTKDQRTYLKLVVASIENALGDYSTWH